MNPINATFATPLLHVQTDTQSLAAELQPVILDHATEANRKKNSPQGMHPAVFESEFNFFELDAEPIAKLRTLFSSYLGGFVKEVLKPEAFDPDALRFDQDCWYHITRSGGSFQPHNHPNASWSIVYCVNPGDAKPAEDREAGHVVFSDPRTANMHIDPANRRMKRQYSFDLVRLRLAAAELLIFPSFLLHWVEPYSGDEPRITVAANYWFHGP
ncbi:MAG: putative 2OG-Fe(II) oxygenase [Pseudomonadota bacterium]